MAEIKTCYGCKYLEDMRCSNKEAHYFRGFQCSKYAPQNSKEIIAEQLREIAENIYREAEKVPVVVEKAGTVTNGDMVREALSKLSDYEISHIEFCNLYDICDECPMHGMKKCMNTATARQLWLKQEVEQNGNC